MTGKRICKVCGSEYEYCHTLRKNGIFRWQDVACCQEHGAEYFLRVEMSRNAPAESIVIDPDDDEDEYEDEEEYDDEEE